VSNKKSEICAHFSTDVAALDLLGKGLLPHVHTQGGPLSICI